MSARNSPKAAEMILLPEYLWANALLVCACGAARFVFVSGKGHGKEMPAGHSILDDKLLEGGSPTVSSSPKAHLRFESTITEELAAAVCSD